MKWNEILELDPYSNTSCTWCGKSLILSEAVIEGEDIDHIYLLCSYCADYENFTKVKESYNTEFIKEWTGLEPLPISYL